MNKKTKILLINPEVPDTFWSLKNALEFVSKKALLPTFGTTNSSGYAARIVGKEAHRYEYYPLAGLSP